MATEPVRSCVVCREKKRKPTLDRYVWRGEKPMLDDGKRKSGRGVYCCRNEKCINTFLSQEQKWRKIFKK